MKSIPSKAQRPHNCSVNPPVSVFSKPAGICCVLADSQEGVIVEDAVEDIARLARGTGNGAGGIDAVLVGGVGVQRECPFIVAEVAGIEGAEQTVALDGEPLAIGRRAAAVTPDPAQGQLVMVIQCHQVSRYTSCDCARLNEVAVVVYISYE